MDGAALLELTREDLKELVPLVGDRARLAALVAKAREVRTVERRNSTTAAFQAHRSACGNLSDAMCCSPLVKYRVTELALEACTPPTLCTPASKRSVDLADVHGANVRELMPPWVSKACCGCWRDVFGCNCGLARLVVETEDEVVGVISVKLPSAAAADALVNVRNAFESHSREHYAHAHGHH